MAFSPCCVYNTDSITTNKPTSKYYKKKLLKHVQSTCLDEYIEYNPLHLLDMSLEGSFQLIALVWYCHIPQSKV